MDNQSSEIIQSFIDFLIGKKEVVSKYNDKYSNDNTDEVTLKRYEFDDIISELKDSISQSIQAIRSLQIENDNLKENILSIQQYSNLKQSLFCNDDKAEKLSKCSNFNYEDKLDDQGEINDYKYTYYNPDIKQKYYVAETKRR